MSSVRHSSPIYLRFDTSDVLVRIIDLQVCAWLKQDPLESDRISTWIDAHQHVLQLDSKVIADGDEERICRKIASEVLLYASIVPLMEQQMNKRNLWNYYITVEMPALNIILQMLLNGVFIDREELIRERENLLVSSFMASFR